jgi:hypothetical protein
MAKWLIVRIIILENRKKIWIIYSNSNTFHVLSFFRFKSMHKIQDNAFLNKNGIIVNSLNSSNDYFRKQKIVLDYLFKFKHFSCCKFLTRTKGVGLDAN